MTRDELRAWLNLLPNVLDPIRRCETGEQLAAVYANRDRIIDEILAALPDPARARAAEEVADLTDRLEAAYMAAEVHDYGGPEKRKCLAEVARLSVEAKAAVARYRALRKES